MKYLISILLIASSIIADAQATYKAGAVKTAVGMIKYEATIEVRDSLFTVIDGKTNKHANLKIVKKVNDGYFKVTDGMEDYIITIVEVPTAKFQRFEYSTVIGMRRGETLLTTYFCE